MNSNSESSIQEEKLVSIGLPVFNGANYLSEAINSILNQSYANLELIICDNASTDATPSICESFAKQDSRVLYYRNPCNLGAAQNYDKCFSHSKGFYFKWFAHDDRMEADCIQKNIDALIKNPDAIMCTNFVRAIDHNGETLGCYNPHELPLDDHRTWNRFGSALKMQHCVDFFGTYIRESLIGSQLHGNFISSDRVLLAEMAIRGKIIRLKEPLFIHRQHNLRFSVALFENRKAAASWWTSNRTLELRNKFCNWTAFIGFASAIKRSARTRQDSINCHIELAQLFFRRYLVLMLSDILWNISPRLYSSIKKPFKRL